MAYGNWEDVIETFEGVIGHYRYGELAQQMLDLVLSIRNDPHLTGLVPGTSLLALFFTRANGSGRVYVIWEEKDIYLVRTETPDEEREKRVRQDEVAFTISDLLG